MVYTVITVNLRSDRMDTVKARNQGNSTVLTIPKNFNVSQGAEFTVTRQADGSILYQPKEGYDIWSDKTLDSFDYEKELQEEYRDLEYNPRKVKPVGKELLND